MRPAVGLFVVGLWISVCPFASADEEDAAALPSVEVMPCLEKCGSFVPAKHVDQLIPKWDPRHAGTYVEALVRIRYNIGTDGRVHDAAVLNVIRPARLAKIALSAL